MVHSYFIQIVHPNQQPTTAGRQVFAGRQMNRVLAEKGNFEMPIITADDTGHHQPSCSASLIGDVPCRHESPLENAALCSWYSPLGRSKYAAMGKKVSFSYTCVFTYGSNFMGGDKVALNCRWGVKSNFSKKGQKIMLLERVEKTIR